MDMADSGRGVEMAGRMGGGMGSGNGGPGSKELPEWEEGAATRLFASTMYSASHASQSTTTTTLICYPTFVLYPSLLPRPTIELD